MMVCYGIPLSSFVSCDNGAHFSVSRGHQEQSFCLNGWMRVPFKLSFHILICAKSVASNLNIERAACQVYFLKII
jgi:hypothetical protein